MEEIKVFKNKQFGTVRTVEINGEPWFVGKDVAERLGYSNTKDALLRHVDKEDKQGSRFTTSGQAREMTIINESGLYSLVLSSKLPTARQFRRWITSEVIPSIRRNGAYMTPEKIDEILSDPDTIIRLAKDLKAERERNAQLEAHIEADRPKVRFANAVSASETSILIGELAKILKGNGVEIGQNRLFEELRKRGFLIRRAGTDYNTPTQKAMEMGLFKIKETAITHADGHVSVSKTTKVTGKGQTYFVNLFLRETSADA